MVQAQHDTGSVGPQQIVLRENAEDEEEFQEIPGHLSEREQLTLQMSKAEKERGTIRVIECKLCPQARSFGNVGNISALFRTPRREKSPQRQEVRISGREHD